MWKHTLAELIQELRESDHVASWHELPPVEAKTEPLPAELDKSLRKSLQARGIYALYTHQLSAFQAASNGRSIVTVTPTASGKTLCYNLPVLQRITENPRSRALYLFPTKALAHDQKSELTDIIAEMGMDIKSFTYDGDTAPAVRQKVRKAGHIVMTNPDMLHSAILPNHTKWVSLFEHLEYVVVDELHTYKGVFGSHVANVIRRLKRICAFYGSSPVFISTSATIANPKELAEELTGEAVQLVDNNGAPRGKKHIVFYNPPVVNEPLNIRRSATAEVVGLAQRFLANDIQTIVFAKSRMRVEIILRHLQELTKGKVGVNTIRGYRGGYLPKERRAIEQGLRSGDILGVVSTNALELGVDIGQLQVCIMTGYPGSVSSTWQQAGRAGRRHGEAVIIMVAGSAPIDQFVVQNPDYFLSQNPETARLNADNLIILADHVKCAAYEIPFRPGDTFGGMDIRDLLAYLQEAGILHVNAGTYYWSNDSFPASAVSLRSAAQDNVVIVDQSDRGHNHVIGEMDRLSAMTMLHDEAIYLHEGRQYQVEHLDWAHCKAYVRRVEVDYYTDASLAIQLTVLEVDETAESADSALFFGDVMVTILPTIFKKIKLDSFENIGSGPIAIPEEEIHTNACWVELIEEEPAQELDHLLVGIASVLHAVVPAYVLCDAGDIHVVSQLKAPHSGRPTLFIYDHYPGGIGLSKEVYRRFRDITQAAIRLIECCPCDNGCPSCVGTGFDGQRVKENSIALLHTLAGEQPS